MKQKILEKDITKIIRDFLYLKGIFHYKAWQGLGSTKGVSDIIGILPNGRFLAIEVKTSRGVVSAHQQDFIDAINKSGGLAFVARNLDDVINLLHEYNL